MKVKIKDKFINNALDGFREHAMSRGAILPGTLTLFKVSKVAVCNNKFSDEACAGEYFVTIAEDTVSYWLLTEYDADEENGNTYVVYRKNQVN